MGLVKLLTVGRSLKRVRDETHRYKLMTGVMPTFGFDGGAEVGREEPGRMVALEASREAMMSNAGHKSMKTETGESSAKERANAFLLARLSRKANPFKSTVRPAARGALQGELSLANVRVVRNDLSDSDLELVEAASKPAARVEQDAPKNGNVFAARASERAEAKQASWFGRLIGRLARVRIQ